MSNIASLPLLRVTQGVGLDEDWVLPLAFLASGSAWDPIGITFTATLTPASGRSAEECVGVVVGNLLTFTVLAAAKASWPPGLYDLTITAAASDGTKDLLTQSSVTLGQPSPPIVTVILAIGYSPTTVAVAISAQTAANTAAIAAIEAAGGGGGGGTSTPPVQLTGSNTISAAGTYLVATAGSTQTLPLASSWALGDIVIKDWTGSTAPAIALAGTVDGDAGGALITMRGQSLTLRAASSLNTWVII